VSGTDHKRRLVAILAADAAGNSRSIAADERATVVTLNAVPGRHALPVEPICVAMRMDENLTE